MKVELGTIKPTPQLTLGGGIGYAWLGKNDDFGRKIEIGGIETCIFIAVPDAPPPCSRRSRRSRSSSLAPRPPYGSRDFTVKAPKGPHLERGHLRPDGASTR